MHRHLALLCLASTFVVACDEPESAGTSAATFADGGAVGDTDGSLDSTTTGWPQDETSSTARGSGRAGDDAGEPTDDDGGSEPNPRGDADADDDDAGNDDASQAGSTGDVEVGFGSSGGDEPPPEECIEGTEGCECDNGLCDGALLCTQGVCEPATACSDLIEPNDTESSAPFLGEITDSDGSGSSVTSLLEGPDDVDWFRYAGNDNLFSVVNPSIEVLADQSLRVCQFYECADGIDATSAGCPDGVDEVVSPEGRPGCCAPLGFETDASCSFNLTDDDSMDVYIRVDSSAVECVEYTIDYHF